MQRRVTKRALSASVVITTLMLAAGLSGCEKAETSTSLLAEAKQYQQKGDNKAALIQLKNAATKSPDDVEVRFQLASLYNQTGDAVSAEKEIRKAISLGVDGARAAPELAKALLAQGKAQAVIDETAAAAVKAGPELLVIRADAYLALREPAKARTAFDQALVAKPGYSEALIGLARLALYEKDIEGAIRFTEQAASAAPKDPEIWFFKGSLMRIVGKPADAMAAYSQAITVKPTYVNALVERANLQIGEKKYDAAKADIDSAKRVSPGALLVIYTQALLDFSQGKFPAAHESLQKVLRAAPEHMPTILLSGAVAMNLGSLEQAEQHLNKYIERNPENVYARKLLAQTMLKGARPANASAALAPILKEGSQDPQLLALAGESSLRSRDFAKATQYFEKASTLAPSAAGLHTSLGMAKLGEGDQARGIAELERATALDPKSEQAGVALVRAQLALKNFDKALAAAKALVAAQPKNAELRNLEGGVYLAKGERAAARASFEQATTLQPGILGPIMNLAGMDVIDKKPDAAKQRLVAFLEKDKKNVTAMSALANLALSQGKPDEATTWLEKAHAENPEALPAATQLAAHYLRTNQKPKALTLVRKLQTANPTNAELLDLLGQAQLANDDKAGALETYSKLVNVAPKSAAAQFRLASAHMSMKNEAAAAEDLKKAIALQPNFVPAHLAQVELDMRANRPAEAIAGARRIQKLPGQEHAGLIVEADLLMAQKKPAQALPVYEKAFALAKTPQLMIGIHRLLVQAGKEKQADQRLAQWSQQHPTDMMTAMYAAEINLAKKQYKPAIAQLSAILKQSPDNAPALNNLAWAYQQEKDPKALETAERAYKVAGDTPAVMDTLGAILTDHGDTKRSIPLLQKAATLAPNDLNLRLHLAQAFAKSGDKVNARTELQKIVAKGNGTTQIGEAQELLKQL